MSRAVVDAKEFSHAMSKISKILKKCAIPILEEVCLRIQNGRCTLTATDLETWLTAELPASGDDMFFVFRKTKDILRACSHFAGELTMEFSETRSGSKKAGKILLRCERRGAEFEVYDGADYGIIDLPLTDRLYRYKKEEQHGSGSSANKKRLLLHGAEFEIRRWQSQVQMDFNRDTGNWEEKCKVGGRNVSRNQMHL